MLYHLEKRQWRRLTASIAALLLSLQIVTAQQPEVRLKAYGFEDGISHRNIFKVQQDTNGFLWLATAKGLNRFDGHIFIPWTHANGSGKMPGDAVEDMHLDAGNRLWLAFNGQLASFDPFNNVLDTVQLDAKSIAKNKQRQYSNLFTDTSGVLWTATFLPEDNTTWLQRTGSHGVLYDAMKLPGAYEGRPVAQANGRVFAGAFENELWAFDLNGKLIEQYEFPVPGKDRAFSRVIQLQSTKDGTLWALLEHGQVWYLRPGAKSFSRHHITDFALDNVDPSAFLVGENGDIWLCGVGHGRGGDDGSPCSSISAGATLLHYKFSTGRTDDWSYYLKQVVQFSVAPRQIFKDRTGVIWIATEFGLVHLVQTDLFENYMADGNDCCQDGVCSMRGIAGDEDGNIYFTYYNSIHILNPRSGSLTPLFSPQPKHIGRPFSILCHNGALWTGEGLRIDLKTQAIDTIVPLAGAEGMVMADYEGMLWFGCQGSLCTLQEKNPNGKKYTFSEFIDKNGLMTRENCKDITFLYQGKTGNYIWVATKENGLFKVSKKDGALQHYSTRSQPALSHDRVLAVCESAGYLWTGAANGLNRLDLANEKVQVFNTKDGLSNDFINGVLPEGDSAIWVSTDNGLSRFSIQSESFTNFFDTDGLSKNEFNRISFFKANDGRLYFGGLNGVNAFYPDERFASRPGKTHSRLLLTEFSKFDGEKDFHQTSGLGNGLPVNLSYKDKMFTFYFALSDYTDPHMHLYSYRLEGYDKEWTNAAPMNFARYFNIPAGNYKLRVRASRGGGDWVSNELTIPLHIRQAFYKTGWFHLLALGLLALSIMAFMRYRLYRARKHERELEALVQERTQELETEKAKSDELLLNILPAETAEELKMYGAAKARRFENVSVLFSDFKEFSLIASQMAPEALVAEIHFCFRAFDEIMELYGLEKIKTIGDAYMCAGGISGDEDVEDASVRMVKAALEIQAFLKAVQIERAEKGIPCFEARVGIHSGPVVAGIVGIKKFAYDIWGDTVNIAERLQTNGEVGKVNISKSTYNLVKDHFACTPRGKIKAKNKGYVDMYFVDGLAEEKQK